MCLTTPKQVDSIKNGFIFVKAKGGKTEAVGTIITSVKKGDWVLTQNGVIIRKINKKDVKDTIALLNLKKKGGKKV